MIKAQKKDIQSILGLTRSSLEKYGARIPGTKGSTDAAAFAKEGIQAVAMIAMPTSMFAKEYIYNTIDSYGT